MNPHLRVAQKLTKLLDTEFKIFGIRLGLDPILGLIPGIGDAIPLVLSLYIVWIGSTLGLPANKIVQMVVNVVFDFALGLIPIVGDLSDVIFKANVKNLQIIESHQPKYVYKGQVVG